VSSNCVFGLHLGEIKALDKPRAFPLGYFVARSFISETAGAGRRRRACDSPDRGAGLNMGLKDVAALAEVVVDAARLGMDTPDRPMYSTATSAGAGSTPWRWGLPPIH